MYSFKAIDNRTGRKFDVAQAIWDKGKLVVFDSNYKIYEDFKLLLVSPFKVHGRYICEDDLVFYRDNDDNLIRAKVIFDGSFKVKDKLVEEVLDKIEKVEG